MKQKLESIGSFLRNARDKKGISLDEAYSKTKIHPRILQAMEEDRGEEVLSRVYIKSFLKRYSDYLGVASSELIKKGFPPLVSPEPQVQVKEEEPAASGKTSFEFGRKKFLLALVAALSISALLLLVGYASTRLASNFWKFFTRGRQAVSISAPAKKELQVSVTPAPVKPKPAKPETVFTSISEKEDLVLELKAVHDVWIEVKSDGKTVFRRVLSKGSVESWKAKKSINLWLGKAEAVKLVLNGQTLQSPGRGIVKNISLTREGMKVGK